MGLVWRPTSQLDSGIDGEIEIRNTTSGAVSGLFVKVQSKAVSNFENDSADSFDYRPDQRDIDYWLKHNVPVILVVSKPSTEEAYWRPVRDPSGQATSRKFRFSKTDDRLDDSSLGRLIEFVRSQSPGATAVAIKKPERLVSNLIAVTKLPARLYLAESLFETGKEIGEELRKRGMHMEFALRSKRILTVRDL